MIADDGNLLPKPVKVSSARIGVAERVDVIVDFRPFAGKSIFLENRLNQVNVHGSSRRAIRRRVWTGISLTSRMVTPIHPRPFRVNHLSQ